MGYHLTPEFETAVPGKSHASPKTHVPLSRLSDAGHRYYNPEIGRWTSRDPIGEFARFVDVYGYQSSAKAVYSSLQNPSVSWYFLYLFVRNAPGILVDLVGLDTAGKCCVLMTSDCKKICTAFIDAPDSDTSGGGGVVCHGGIKCACGFPIFGFKPGDCPIIDGYIREHEEGHFGGNTCDPHKCLDRPFSNKNKKDSEADECRLRKELLEKLKSLPGVIPPTKCDEFKKKLIERLEMNIKDCPSTKK